MTHKTNPPDVSQVPRGHYNLESLAKEMKRMFVKDDKQPLETEINTPP